MIEHGSFGSVELCLPPGERNAKSESFALMWLNKLQAVRRNRSFCDRVLQDHPVVDGNISYISIQVNDMSHFEQLKGREKWYRNSLQAPPLPLH